MAKNRYDSASAAEKAMFTQLGKTLKDNAPSLTVDHRELEGSLTRPKVMFFLKKNNPGISHIEWVCTGEGVPQRMRVIVSKHTKGTDFYRSLTKTGKAIYGGIVINWEKEEHTLEDILVEVATLAESCEVVDINPPIEEKEEKEEEKAA